MRIDWGSIPVRGGSTRRLHLKRGIDFYGPYHWWVSKKPCVVSQGCFGAVTGHHLRRASWHGDKGNEVSVCAQHHTELHSGRAKFEQRHGIDLALEAERLARTWAG